MYYIILKSGMLSLQKLQRGRLEQTIIDPNRPSPLHFVQRLRRSARFANGSAESLLLTCPNHVQ